jgi:hypothetical protein
MLRLRSLDRKEFRTGGPGQMRSCTSAAYSKGLETGNEEEYRPKWGIEERPNTSREAEEAIYEAILSAGARHTDMA